MSCLSWSKEVVIEFLYLYKKEQILWDPKHVKRKNKTETITAWNRIKSKFSIQCSIDDLKRKKESLMSQYRSLKKKTLKSPEHPSPWYAFPVMDNFLNEIYKRELKSYQNVDCKHLKDSQNDSSYLESQEVIYHNRIPKTDKINKRTYSQTYSKNKIFKTVVRESLSNQSIYKINETNSSAQDKYDLFVQLLAKKLRKLDEHQRLTVMHEIDNIMIRAKIKSHRTELQSISYAPVDKMSSPIFIVSQDNPSNCEDEYITSNEQLQLQATP